MKAKHILLLLVVIILNSCNILKSLQPFYTNKTIQFEKLFLGNWVDEGSGEWNVYTFEEYFFLFIAEEGALEELNNNDMDKNELEEFEKKLEELNNQFKYIYFVKNGVATFLAVPFKIKNQLFLDFSIYDANMRGEIHSKVSDHLIGTHTLVKFDIINNNQVNLRWFPESNLTSLINNNRIKINYEKANGKMDKYQLDPAGSGILLTASSEELQKFLAKYMRSNDYKEWIHEEKSSSSYQLKRTNG